MNFLSENNTEAQLYVLPVLELEHYVAFFLQLRRNWFLSLCFPVLCSAANAVFSTTLLYVC